MFRSIIYRVIKPIEYSAEIQKFRFCTKVQPLNRFRRGTEKEPNFTE